MALFLIYPNTISLLYELIIRKLRHYINLVIVTKSLYNKKDML